jgi:hypothetical protein
MVNKTEIIKPRLKEAIYVNPEKSRPLYVWPPLYQLGANKT